LSEPQQSPAIQLSGYLHPAYAASLAEFGRPRELPRSGGWILERQIDGFEDRDAIGCYPLFTCQDWSRLHQDLEELSDDLVCLGLVTDPFGEYDQNYLRRCFKDAVTPFKEHYIVDLENWKNKNLDRTTRKRIRRAFELLVVEVCPRPLDYLEDWIRLYDVLIERHSIGSLGAFSRAAFARQFEIPGLWMVRAAYQGQTVGIQCVFLQGEVAYGHLIAFDEIGYQLGASYAIDAFVFERLSGSVRWFDLGGVPGLKDEKGGGLREYKLHWATTTRSTYFCGRIFGPSRYAAIAQARRLAGASYFPSYRQGEFGKS
jgi:hypothetical protein